MPPVKEGQLNRKDRLLYAELTYQQSRKIMIVVDYIYLEFEYYKGYTF